MTNAPCGHTSGLRAQATGKKVCLLISIWEGIGYILSQLLPEIPVLISLHMGSDEDPPGTLKLLVDTPHLFPSLFFQQEDKSIWLFHRMSLSPYITFQLLPLPQEREGIGSQIPWLWGLIGLSSDKFPSITQDWSLSMAILVCGISNVLQQRLDHISAARDAGGHVPTQLVPCQPVLSSKKNWCFMCCLIFFFSETNLRAGSTCTEGCVYKLDVG